MDKQERQRKILGLLSVQDVSSQNKLRSLLIELGFNVTQATLSRDLRELNVVKRTSRDGEYKYTTLEHGEGFAVVSCEVSGNLLVLQTKPGLAPAVAYKVDGLNLNGIVGTVAGENTLLAVVVEGYDAREVRKELWRRIQEA